MKDVVLLSEIHPLGLKTYHPLIQAHNWFQLLTPEDLRWIESATINFNDMIALIYERSNERGKTLVIRDWNHLDFTAVPFLPEPSYRLATAETLNERFNVVPFATVRHPIDQWLSLRKLQIMQGKINLIDFLHGYLRFAEHAVRTGFVRYEDFVNSPDAKLAIICTHLKIPFDPTYSERWADYITITGDTSVRERRYDEIKSLPRRPVEPDLIAQFARNEDYNKAIEILGYGHPL